MLSHLRIRNLIVVAEATMELSEGLNVLSGGTGGGEIRPFGGLAPVHRGPAKKGRGRSGRGRGGRGGLLPPGVGGFTGPGNPGGECEGR